jgi:hypothetical protein
MNRDVYLAIIPQVSTSGLLNYFTVLMNSIYLMEKACLQNCRKGKTA